MEKKEIGKVNKKIDIYGFLKKIDITKLNKNNPYILENCEIYENKKIIGIKMKDKIKTISYKDGIEFDFDDISKYEFLIIKIGLLLDYSGNLRKKEEFDIIVKTWNKNEKEGKVFIYNNEIIYKK